MGARLLVAFLLTSWLAPAAHAAPAPRILYAGDWPGPTEIFAVDPSGRARSARSRPGGPTSPAGTSPRPAATGCLCRLRTAGGCSSAPPASRATRSTARRTGWRPPTAAASARSARSSARLVARLDPDRVLGQGRHPRRARRRERRPDRRPAQIADARVVACTAMLSRSRPGRRSSCCAAATSAGCSVPAERRTSPGLRTAAGSLLRVPARRRQLGEGRAGAPFHPARAGHRRRANPAWAPNRDAMAYVRPDGIRVADPRSGRSSLLVPLHPDRTCRGSSRLLRLVAERTAGRVRRDGTPSSTSPPDAPAY